MAKTIDIDYNDFEVPRRIYSDVEYVQRLLSNRQIQYALYVHWEHYFNTHAGSEFFHLEEHRLEIIHNAYEVLWMKVKTGKIYVEDGVLKGKDGKPFKATLTSYMMSVARINNLEIWRGDRKTLHIEDLGLWTYYKVDCDDDNDVTKAIASEPVEDSPFLVPSEKMVMMDIVAEYIANMSKRCSQILTMFYYDGMKLDSILERLPTITSKKTLKSKKARCMASLKMAARKRYEEYLNS